jgi:uncharacterized protein (DUF952 family)/ADP-ribose pyrophosphatase YjhB (NUDIX family)/uncharacterized protein YjbJ (UPF0337 family)
MRPLFHIAEPGDWPASGEYRPPSLDAQGFVHFSFADQVESPANNFYADAPVLEVVEVDPARLDSPIVVEDSYGAGVAYPHVYAAVPASAAVAVRSLRRVDGRWSFPVIRVSAVVLRDDRGRVLSVRKRGTDTFIFPGGKPEPGESARDAALRELAEELSIVIRPEQLRELGSFVADAANEADHVVEGAVFEAAGVDVADLRPAAEIEEVRWDSLDSGGYPPDLAKLSANVFDVLRSRGVAATLGGMADDDAPHEHPATWENKFVGKAKEWFGKALHDKQLVEEGEDQDEIAHEVHDEYKDERD